MQETRGDVVVSLAGRDKGGVFAVVSADEHYVYIANGRARKLEAPKRKQRKHLCKIEGQRVDVVTNKQLWRSLRACRDRVDTDPQGG